MCDWKFKKAFMQSLLRILPPNSPDNHLFHSWTSAQVTYAAYISFRYHNTYSNIVCSCAVAVGVRCSLSSAHRGGRVGSVIIPTEKSLFAQFSYAALMAWGYVDLWLVCPIRRLGKKFKPFTDWIRMAAHEWCRSQQIASIIAWWETYISRHPCLHCPVRITTNCNWPIQIYPRWRM